MTGVSSIPTLIKKSESSQMFSLTLHRNKNFTHLDKPLKHSLSPSFPVYILQQPALLQSGRLSPLCHFSGPCICFCICNCISLIPPPPPPHQPASTYRHGGGISRSSDRVIYLTMTRNCPSLISEEVCKKKQE